MRRILPAEDRLPPILANIYEDAGFRAYKMRKFEEYSLYLENRSFLESERVITFNDMTGRLLALKPDVTLSIVKNAKADRKGCEKLYYRESVYRLDRKSGEYREINQMGLEVIGDTDMLQTLEVLSLAVRTLEATGEEYVLDVSHMGVISAVTGLIDGLREDDRAQILCLIKTKNPHDLAALCARMEVGEEIARTLAVMAGPSFGFEDSLRKLKESAPDAAAEALSELESIYSALSSLGLAGSVELDFSIVNDTDYYNGIIFQGFVKGIHKEVLSGGRYDGLLSKFGKKAGALGFAVYLTDLAPRREGGANDCDYDVLLRYSDGSDPKEVLKKAAQLRADGSSVRVEKEIPAGLRFGRTEEV